jgi:hypothetical protein
VYKQHLKGKEEYKMPTVIDKTPIHDDAIGWSRGAIRYARGEVDPRIIIRKANFCLPSKGSCWWKRVANVG